MQSYRGYCPQFVLEFRLQAAWDRVNVELQTSNQVTILLRPLGQRWSNRKDGSRGRSPHQNMMLPINMSGCICRTPCYISRVHGAHSLFSSRFRQVTCRRLGLMFLMVGWAGIAAVNASAEVVFQDFFTQPAGSITNSVPWIDVEGNGWQSGPTASQLATDGNGHLYNAAASAGAAAGVQLVPIGPHGSMTASAVMQLPTGFNEWIGMGFASSNSFLSAPGAAAVPGFKRRERNDDVLRRHRTEQSIGSMNAFTNDGNPVRAFLTYDAFHGTASAGTVSDSVTNLIFNQWPVTNSAGSVTPHYLIFQMSTNLTTPTARWATAATVDWLPRPPPMLTLPVPVQRTNFVGSPGTNDVLLIQNAFNSVSNFPGRTEIRFTAGATYIISNGLTAAHIPLALVRATNVVVNGNGCKILIRNPHVGFLSVNNSSNVIVEGFSVDYDPLPFTQGVVTHNFSNDVPKEVAIEFLVDAGYPAPTNDNYLDPNASRWGMVIDPTRPGRVAYDARTQAFYTNVVQTNANGAFKVYLTSSASAKTIPPGESLEHDFPLERCHRVQRLPVESGHVSEQYQLHRCRHQLCRGGFTHTCEINDQVSCPARRRRGPLRAAFGNLECRWRGIFIDSRIGPWIQGCSFTVLSDDVANACLTPFIDH